MHQCGLSLHAGTCILARQLGWTNGHTEPAIPMQRMTTGGFFPDADEAGEGTDGPASALDES